MKAVLFTLIPVLAVILGSLVAVWRRPGEAFVSSVQHMAAGVVYAAAATEIFPKVLHQASPTATLIGGALGVVLMISLKALQAPCVSIGELRWG